MKRAFTYIFIFLGICAVLKGMSKLAENFIKEDTLHRWSNVINISA